MVLTPLMSVSERKVTEARGVCDVVKRAGSSKEFAQLHSASAPNPQKTKLYEEVDCSITISFA
jgi:hypothetical protein